jgi:hypothetical protein
MFWYCTTVDKWRKAGFWALLFLEIKLLRVRRRDIVFFFSRNSVISFTLLNWIPSPYRRNSFVSSRDLNYFYAFVLEQVKRPFPSNPSSVLNSVTFVLVLTNERGIHPKFMSLQHLDFVHQKLYVIRHRMRSCQSVPEIVEPLVPERTVLLV